MNAYSVRFSASASCFYKKGMVGEPYKII